jgi:hypothetical protein
MVTRLRLIATFEVVDPTEGGAAPPARSYCRIGNRCPTSQRSLRSAHIRHHSQIPNISGAKLPLLSGHVRWPHACYSPAFSRQNRWTETPRVLRRWGQFLPALARRVGFFASRLALPRLRRICGGGLVRRTLVSGLLLMASIALAIECRGGDRRLQTAAFHRSWIGRAARWPRRSQG